VWSLRPVVRRQPAIRQEVQPQGRAERVSVESPHGMNRTASSLGRAKALWNSLPTLQDTLQVLVLGSGEEARRRYNACASPLPDRLMSTLAVILIATGAGSLLSLLIAGVLALSARPAWVPVLVSYAIGALLGASLLEVLPEAVEMEGNVRTVGVALLGGILLFFLLEKLVLWRHCHDEVCEAHGSPRPRPWPLRPDDHGRRHLPQFRRRRHHRRCFPGRLPPRRGDHAGHHVARNSAGSRRLPDPAAFGLQPHPGAC
jgi:hypothetical protein